MNINLQNGYLSKDHCIELCTSLLTVYNLRNSILYPKHMDSLRLIKYKVEIIHASYISFDFLTPLFMHQRPENGREKLLVGKW